MQIFCHNSHSCSSQILSVCLSFFLSLQTLRCAKADDMKYCKICPDREADGQTDTHTHPGRSTIIQRGPKPLRGVYKSGWRINGGGEKYLREMWPCLHHSLLFPFFFVRSHCVVPWNPPPPPLTRLSDPYRLDESPTSMAHSPKCLKVSGWERELHSLKNFHLSHNKNNTFLAQGHPKMKNRLKVEGDVGD